MKYRALQHSGTLLCALAVGVLFGAREAAAQSCGIKPPPVPRSNCTLDPMVQTHLANISALLKAIGGGMATDDQIEQYMTEFIGIQRGCEGTTKDKRLRTKYVETILPRIAFGLNRASFANFLAARGGVQRFPVYGQPLPPGALNFEFPVVASFRHPDGHAFSGTITAETATAVPLRQIVVFEQPDGTVTVSSVSDSSVTISLPAGGVTSLDIAVAPIGCIAVAEPLSVTPLLSVVGAKPTYCHKEGFWCPDCVRHTSDCALYEEDCRPKSQDTCLKRWTQDLTCECQKPFTDP